MDVLGKSCFFLGCFVLLILLTDKEYEVSEKQKGKLNLCVCVCTNVVLVFHISKASHTDLFFPLGSQ